MAPALGVRFPPRVSVALTFRHKSCSSAHGDGGSCPTALTEVTLLLQPGGPGASSWGLAGLGSSMQLRLAVGRQGPGVSI